MKKKLNQLLAWFRDRDSLLAEQRGLYERIEELDSHLDSIGEDYDHLVTDVNHYRDEVVRLEKRLAKATHDNAVRTALEG